MRWLIFSILNSFWIVICTVKFIIHPLMLVHFPLRDGTSLVICWIWICRMPRHMSHVYVYVFFLYHCIWIIIMYPHQYQYHMPYLISLQCHSVPKPKPVSISVTASVYQRHWSLSLYHFSVFVSLLFITLASQDCIYDRLCPTLNKPWKTSLRTTTRSNHRTTKNMIRHDEICICSWLSGVSLFFSPDLCHLVIWASAKNIVRFEPWIFRQGNS